MSSTSPAERLRKILFKPKKTENEDFFANTDKKSVMAKTKTFSGKAGRSNLKKVVVA